MFLYACKINFLLLISSLCVVSHAADDSISGSPGVSRKVFPSSNPDSSKEEERAAQRVTRRASLLIQPITEKLQKEADELRRDNVTSLIKGSHLLPAELASEKAKQRGAGAFGCSTSMGKDLMELRKKLAFLECARRSLEEKNAKQARQIALLQNRIKALEGCGTRPLLKTRPEPARALEEFRKKIDSLRGENASLRRENEKKDLEAMNQQNIIKMLTLEVQSYQEFLRKAALLVTVGRVSER